MYPFLANKIKDSVSLKKAALGDGNWAQTKEILAWIINTKRLTMTFT